MQNPGKGLTIAGLVCGIVAIVFSFVYLWNILGLICGIVGLVLTIVGRKKNEAAGVPQTGLSKAALIVSIIGLCLSVIGFFTCTVCVACIACNAENVNVESIDWSSFN